MSAAQEALLLARGLVKHFPQGRGRDGEALVVRAVDGVDLAVATGETLALVGESGCGKSTLGRLLLRLIEPSAGSVRFDGDDLTALSPSALRRKRRAMQMIFQDPYSSLNPRMTVGQLIAEPLKLHGLARGRKREHERVAELLRQVGLSEASRGRYPHEFSGGQRQRIGIARALAVEPRLIVCDEPVSALDVSIQAQVLNLLTDLQRELGLTYVFISHNLAVVRHIADRVAVMYLGQIVETAGKDALFSSPRHPYTQALLSAIPRPQPGAAAQRIVLEGDTPNPIHPPAGCRFHTRCPHARSRCAEEPPTLAADAGDSHAVACHFWKEIAPPASALPHPAPRDAAMLRLERLQAAFRPQTAPQE